MENIIGLLIILFVGSYLYLRNKEEREEKRRTQLKEMYGSKTTQKIKRKAKSYTPMNEDEIEAEAKKIASNIKTHKGLQALEDKIAVLSEKSFEYHQKDNETMYSKTEENILVYEYALQYVGDKPFMYYYDGCCPDIDTPMSVLKNAGKLISVENFEGLDENLKSYYEAITLDEVETIKEAKKIAADAVSEYKKEIKDLISINSIIESDLNEEEKEKQFNKIVGSSKFLMEELDLNKDDDFSFYRQFNEDKIHNEKMRKLYPLPHAWILIKNGVETLEEVKTLSDEELLALSDIGPKRLADIREYLNHL